MDELTEQLKKRRKEAANAVSAAKRQLSMAEHTLASIDIAIRALGEKPRTLPKRGLTEGSRPHKLLSALRENGPLTFSELIEKVGDDDRNSVAVALSVMKRDGRTFRSNGKWGAVSADKEH